MLTIEVWVPRGMLTAAQRRTLAATLTAKHVLTFTDEASATTDPGVLELYESLTNIVVTETDAWVAAGDLVTADGPNRYLVNFYVGAWANEIGEHLIEGVTSQINEFDTDHTDADARPQVLVHIIDVSQGHYGLNGKVVTPTDFTDMIADAHTRQDTEAPEGTFIDPTCGAIIPVEEAFALERDGVTYGFCCPGCRGRFAKKQDKLARTSLGEDPDFGRRRMGWHPDDKTGAIRDAANPSVDRYLSRSGLARSIVRAGIPL